MNPGTIEADQFLPHPPARVWRALIEPELMGRWLVPPTGFAPVLGQRFSFDMGEWGTTWCEVLEVVPERLLRISWRNEPLDTTVTFRLVPEGTGTRLLLAHEGFDLDDPADRAAHEGMGEGWRTNVVQRLDAVLAGLAAGA